MILHCLLSMSNAELQGKMMRLLLPSLSADCRRNVVDEELYIIE